jgi:hypothetical protein
MCKLNVANTNFNKMYSFFVHFYNMDLNNYENIYDVTFYKV